MSLIRKLKTSTKGATAIEYGLIAALVGVVIIVGARFLGTSLNGIFTSVATTVNNP